jgi:hypothetical protein
MCHMQTHYLHNIVGDIKLRKHDGMQLDQLYLYIQIISFSRDILKEAFQLRETAPIDFLAVRNFM